MDLERASVYNLDAVPAPRLVAMLVSALFVCLLAWHRTAHADAQVSVRTELEVGKRKAEIGDSVIFGAGLRGDVMFGAPKPRAFRIGPAFELRSIDFETAEAAVGGGLLIPMPGDFPFGLTGLVGYATRSRAPDAPVGIGTLTWGYRGYNFHHWYGYGLNLFVSARRDLSGPDIVEITGGVEIDVLFTTIIPLLAIRNWVTGGDPHEPAQPIE